MKVNFEGISKKYPNPKDVQKFLRSFPYNFEKKVETQKSAGEALRAKSMHCLEAVLVAAAILENAGYPPLVLSLESVDNLDHVLFIFKEKTGWGAIGKSRMVGLHGRKPVFRTVRDLAWSYFDPFIDKTGRVTGYGVAHLDQFKCDWRRSKKNVWAVVNGLIKLPHKKLRGSERRYKKFYNYFLATGESGIKQPSWW